MSDDTMLPDQVKIENALRAVFNNLTENVNFPARADRLLIDVFGNEHGTQLVFRTDDPFVYAHHDESLNTWALVARLGHRRRLIALTRRHAHHVPTITTLDDMLKRALERNND